MVPKARFVAIANLSNNLRIEPIRTLPPIQPDQILPPLGSKPRPISGTFLEKIKSTGTIFLTKLIPHLFWGKKYQFPSFQGIFSKLVEKEPRKFHPTAELTSYMNKRCA